MSDEIYTGGLGALSLIGDNAPQRLAYLAQRMGYRVDPRTYEGQGVAPPSTVEIDVARGRGPYICTQIVLTYPSNGTSATDIMDYRVDISRGATSLFDGKAPAELFSRTGYIDNASYGAALPNLIRRHAPVVLDQDTLSIYTELYPNAGAAVADWNVELSGFHTDPAFAEYVQTKLGELGLASVEMFAPGLGQPIVQKTLSLSRPLSVSAVVGHTQLQAGGVGNVALEIRRNTLQLFSRGFATSLPMGLAMYDLNVVSDGLAHSASTNDLYEVRAQATNVVVAPSENRSVVTLAGARVYTR